MYYIYLIRNKETKKTYIGYTEDLKRRFEERRDKNPELVYYEAYERKEDAWLRERKLKQRGQSVRWLKSRLQKSLSE